jgi:hypothetical protein
VIRPTGTDYAQQPPEGQWPPQTLRIRRRTRARARPKNAISEYHSIGLFVVLGVGLLLASCCRSSCRASVARMGPIT